VLLIIAVSEVVERNINEIVVSVDGGELVSIGIWSLIILVLLPRSSSSCADAFVASIA
jgi:hypothetical protein